MRCYLRVSWFFFLSFVLSVPLSHEASFFFLFLPLIWSALIHFLIFSSSPFFITFFSSSRLISILCHPIPIPLFSSLYYPHILFYTKPAHLYPTVSFFSLLLLSLEGCVFSAHALTWYICTAPVFSFPRLLCLDFFFLVFFYFLMDSPLCRSCLPFFLLFLPSLFTHNPVTLLAAQIIQLPLQHLQIYFSI